MKEETGALGIIISLYYRCLKTEIKTRHHIQLDKSSTTMIKMLGSDYKVRCYFLESLL